ncbi:LAMI_0G10682g1_1 [Lachancea mirantina]|uniref:EKC/KEOPS complex subunit CGI121 n=1 Tax=Lachancea mirantina TaxID=1230905 RepID=A0A1G4KAP9_9SACH|nr:LAMI_0G10682g1_1 [Lachancea mirantina]
MTETMIPQFPDYSIYAGLYVEVANSKELHSVVSNLPFAFIEADTICSREQLFSAVYKALIESSFNKQRTKTLNSECILSLSPTSNIGEAFKRFGISEKTSRIVVLSIVAKTEKAILEAKELIHGVGVDLTDEALESGYDLGLIKKVCSRCTQLFERLKKANLLLTTSRYIELQIGGQIPSTFCGRIIKNISECHSAARSVTRR